MSLCFFKYFLIVFREENVNGALWGWGRNNQGQTGDGTTTNPRPTPIQSPYLSSGVTAIGVGNDGFNVNHAGCAIVNGGVKCWGDNTVGELGIGVTGGQYLVPQDVVGLTSGVTALFVGGYTNCAVQNGVKKCWGAGLAGQLGNGSSSNSPIPVTVNLP